MKVQYSGSVRTTTGERQREWERSATTLRELPRGLALHYDPRFKYWMLDRGNVPDEHIVVGINERDSSYPVGTDTLLQSGDTIILDSMMHIQPAF